MTDNKHEIPNLSWTQLTMMSSCSRAWYLRYVKKMEKVDVTSKYYMHLGKLFHAGLESWLAIDDPSVGVDECIENGDIPPTLLVAIEQDFNRLFNHYKEDLEHSLEGYTIALIDGVPAVEYQFEVDNFVGKVDTILKDVTTNEYVVIDFKLKKRLDRIDKEVRGQLPFYVSCLNTLPQFKDNPITKYGYVELAHNTPKPARILKSGILSEANQDTHWDYWLQTIPVGYNIDEKFWRNRLQNKLKSPNDYFRFIVNEITIKEQDFFNELRVSVYDNAVYLRSEVNVPLATLSTHICRMCDFNNICASDISLSNLDNFVGGDYRLRN